MTDVRSSQLGRSILRDGPAPVRVAQIAREVLRDSDPSVRVARVDRSILRDGPGGVRVAQLTRQILRSRRDSPYPHFPVRLFHPPAIAARLEGGTIVGGTSPGQDTAIEAMDAGARWVMEFGETPLWSRDKVHAWRSFATASDIGVMPVIIPAWDRLYQPLADPKYAGATTFGQVVWRDTPAWEADEVQAQVTVAAAQYATELAFAFAGGDLTGGEQFSIYGPRYGWRLYRIVRISADVDGVKTAVIRPPLREWAGAGQALNFDSPRCTMRPEGDISEVIELLRLGRGVARFVETFVRYP